MFGGRRAKPVDVIVKSFGEDLPLKLRALSALEANQIRIEFPEPIPPKREVDGSTVIDDRDPEYLRDLFVWINQFEALKLCRMIGAEEFGTENVADQVRLLKADFTESEYQDLLKVARLVGAGDVTPEKLEAARAKLRPFASGSERTEPS